jgi:hypothetical protein
MSSLENLPAELRKQILMNVADLPTLRSLVRASPVMHALYRECRDKVLCTCLNRELDGVFGDAYACAASRAYRQDPPWVWNPCFRYKHPVRNFLIAYAFWRSGSIPSALHGLNPMPASRFSTHGLCLKPSACPDAHELLHPGCVRRMAAFHLSVVRPLARLYSRWALANLAQAVSSPADDTVMVSPSEQIRIFRAVYRYETYHNVHDRNEGKAGYEPYYRMNRIFFSDLDFHPWEAEEIGCIDLFVRQKYQDIFGRVGLELRPVRAGEYDKYVNDMISRGLGVMLRLLDIGDNDALATEMGRHLGPEHTKDVSLREMLEEDAQRDRRRRREPMHFAGDVVPPEGPPFGWLVLWGMTYSNLHGEYVPRTVREWG